MGAGSSGSEPSGKDAALLAALSAEQSLIARGALVDDGGLRQAPVQAELELVGRSPTQTKTTLPAGVRAIGFAASSGEVAAAHGAHGWLVWKRAIVTQRGCPPQEVVGVGASTRR